MSENKNNIQYLGPSPDGDLYVQLNSDSNGGARFTVVFNDGTATTADLSNNGSVLVESPPAAALEEAKSSFTGTKQK